jgi:NAD(P)-dependent dehydrogenase (short-subunit alcohol dehydrogenase family)
VRVIVVGASVGIGAALVVQLASAGHRVVALARREAELRALEARGGGAVLGIVHDVTDTAAVVPALEAAIAWLGGLDAIVYNAGVLPVIGLHTFDTAIDHHTLAVNLGGAIAWLNPVAERFDTEGRGVIVGVGSVAGDRGRKPSPAYGASKAGLHSFLESLRNRLGPRGVRVVTIKPGPVRTAMMAARGSMPFMVEPEVAAAAIARSLTAGPEVVYVARIWWPIMRLVQHLPSWLFRRLNA